MGKCSMLEKISYPHTRTRISESVPSWLLNGITTYRYVPRLYTIQHNRNGITYTFLDDTSRDSSRDMHDPHREKDPQDASLSISSQSCNKQLVQMLSLY